MNETGNEQHICADTVPERARLESLLRIALEQWPFKSEADRAIEKRLIARDMAAYEAGR